MARAFTTLIATLLIAAPAVAQELTRAPELVTEVLPAYPQDLQDEGVHGVVVVRITIDEDGVPSDVQVTEPLHPTLDATAVEAAWQLIFTPAEVDGAPAAIAIDYRFVFRIAEVQRPDLPPPTAELTGTVADRDSGQPIADVTVSISGTEQETRTDREGRFALPDLEPGQVKVVLFHPDFQRQVEAIELVSGERMTVESFLARTDASRHETIVTGRTPWREVERAPLEIDTSAVVGNWELTRRDIELAPGAMGDVAKVVGQLPGVTSDTDMFALFHVRGGDADETAFYLDGVQLLNPNHLGGTFTMFNPKLVDKVTLYASAPPAPWTDSLAGALDVQYIDGDPEDFDGIIDFNMAMGSAHVSGPLGPRGSPLTFLVSARRSYFEAYFGLLRAVGLFSDQFVGMAFGEYLGRVTAKGPRTRFRFTVLHAHDNLSLDGETEEGDEALVTLENGIDQRANTTLISGDLNWELHDRVTWRNLVYFTYDFENRLQDADFEVSREVRTWRPGWRSDLELQVGDTHHIRTGADVAYFSLGGDGSIKDPRSTPTWAALPWANLGAPQLSFDSSRAWTEVALYVEDDWQQLFGSPINVRSGVRVTPMHPTGEVLVSPRMAVAVTVPATYTTFKASWGIVHQPLRDPMLFDPSIGASDLKAERALHLTTGVQQLLPFGALLRVEAYHKVLDRLLVNPDTQAAVQDGPAYASLGTGTASGLDVFFAMRTGRVGMAATYSLLVTERTNPLNEAGPQTYAPAWDQRHGFRLMGEIKLGRHRNWLIAGMWELRTGRPRTPVSPTLDSDGDGWHVVPHDYNSRSYGPWTELSLRFEHFRILKDRVKLAVYIDVLNATYAQGEFVWIYGPGATADDGTATAPEPFVFRQLPIRPWIGVRAEF